MSTKSEPVFRALADMQRRRLLRLLRSGELPAGDIAHQLGLAPGTVSHHLGKLRDAELVRVRRDGTQRIYALNTSVVEEIMVMLTDIFHPSEGTES